MAELDNPAGRLHALIRRYVGNSGEASFKEAWAEVLDVEVPADVYPRLAAVRGLVDDVRRSIASEETDAFDALDERVMYLSECIYPTQFPPHQPSSDIQPDEVTLILLRAYSLHLHNHRPDGNVPTTTQTEDLLLDAIDLQQAVTASALDPKLKRKLTERLAAIVEALETLDIGGPNAVADAIDALAGTAVIQDVASQDSGVLRQAGAFMGKALVFLTMVNATTGQLVEAQENVQKLIGAAPVARLNPGTEPAQDHEPIAAPGHGTDDENK